MGYMRKVLQRLESTCQALVCYVGNVGECYLECNGVVKTCSFYDCSWKFKVAHVL